MFDANNNLPFGTVNSALQQKVGSRRSEAMQPNWVIRASPAGITGSLKGMALDALIGARGVTSLVKTLMEC